MIRANSIGPRRYLITDIRLGQVLITEVRIGQTLLWQRDG